jgi:hypothetical protein
MIIVDSYKFASSAPTTFDMTIVTDAEGQDYTINIASGSSPNITVDWGDGTTQTFTTTGQKSRTYSSAGTYNAKLSGSFASGGNIRFGSVAGNRSRLKSVSPFPFIPGLNSFQNCLENCTGLTGSIPADLFRYNTLTTNFSGCLRGNTGLTGSIPADLFRYNTLATDFSSCLLGSTELILSQNIFSPSSEYATRFLNQSVNFSSALNNVGTLAGSPGIAPELWLYNFGTGTPTRTSCFSGSSLLTATNYLDIPVNWRT